MKKKALALVLSAVMVAAALSGCSSKKKETEAETKAAATEAAAPETEATAVEEAVTEAQAAVEEAVSEAAEATQEAVSEAAEATQEAVSEAAEAVEEAVTEAAEEAQEAVSEAGADAAAAVTAAAVAEEAVSEAVEGAEGVVEEAQEAVSEAAEAVEEAVTEAAEAAEEVVSEAAATAEETAEEVQEAVSEAAETAEETVEEAQEAVSEAGADAADAAAAAVTAAAAAAEETVDGAEEAVSEAAEAVQEEVSEVVEAVEEAVEEAVSEAAEVTGAAEEAVSEAAEVVEETVSEAAETAEETTEGTRLNACIASEPETLDPNLESSVDGATYAMHMFENLMKYEQTADNAALDDSDNVKLLVPTYGQAESYDVSDDGLTYTFHLRDDIFWSDGEPVVAANWEYSWKRIVDPANAADYGYILDGIVENAAAIQAGEKEPAELGVTAVDDKTLEVKLEAECPYFIGLCAFAALEPLREDVVEAKGIEWTNPENIVSNGEYVLTEWVHDSYLEMTKNDKYYGEVAGPDVIRWYLNNSQTAQLASFQAGEYDFFDDLPVDQIADLRDQGVAHSANQVGTYYLYMSCDNIPDWRVRAAIALSIDRENIVENVTQGGQTPATGIVAAGITNCEDAEWTETYGEVMYKALAELYPDADLETYSGRCDLAQQLLEEAVADGYDTSATINYEFNTSEAHKAVAEAVQSDVKSVLDLDITLNNSEWQTYTNNLGEGKFGLARLGWIADYDDAITYIELFTNGNSYNYGNWVSDDYTKLVEEAKTLPDGAERDELLAQAETLLFGENGWTVSPIYFYTQQYCINPDVKNVGWTPLGYFMFDQAVIG